MSNFRCAHCGNRSLVLLGDCCRNDLSGYMQRREDEAARLSAEVERLTRQHDLDVEIYKAEVEMHGEVESEIFWQVVCVAGNAQAEIDEAQEVYLRQGAALAAERDETVARLTRERDEAMERADEAERELDTEHSFLAHALGRSGPPFSDWENLIGEVKTLSGYNLDTGVIDGPPLIERLPAVEAELDALQTRLNQCAGDARLPHKNMQTLRYALTGEDMRRAIFKLIMQWFSPNNPNEATEAFMALIRQKIVEQPVRKQP